MKKFWKSFGWFWMSVLPMVLCVILQLLAGLAVMVVYAIIAYAEAVAGGIADQTMLNDIMYSSLMKGTGPGVFAYHVIGTGVFGLWYYLQCVRKKERRPFRTAVNLQSVLTGIVIGVGLCLFTTALVGTAAFIVPDIIEDFYQMMEQMDIGNSVLVTIATVILAPIGEELLCRGVILYYARKISRRFWVANVVQALMFGIMHMNIVQGIYAFLIGLVLGWLYDHYKSVYIPILVHFVVNFSSTFWMEGALSWLPYTLPVNVVLLLTAVGICIGGYFISKSDRFLKLRNCA